MPAKAAKRQGGNWLPLAKGAENALERMRTLHETVSEIMSHPCGYRECDGWKRVQQEIVDVANVLRLALKGRG